MKKHEDFEKSLAAQEDKIKALDEFADKLIDGNHYAADDVEHRRSIVSTLTQLSVNKYKVLRLIYTIHHFFTPSK